jgi:hypothetical protein
MDAVADAKLLAIAPPVLQTVWRSMQSGRDDKLKA